MLLTGVRVVEWATGSLAAAFCARLLGDLGADVVKLEPAGGDDLRRAAPLLDLPDGRREGAMFAYLNAGKRSVALPTGEPARAATVRALCGTADVLVLAIAFEDQVRALVADMRRARPGMVVLRISPFGDPDPSGDVDGFASDMVMQHRGGFAVEHARPVEDPASQPPIGGADREMPLATGIAAAAACVSGLLARDRRRGTAPALDLSKLDFVAHLCIDAFSATQRGQTAFPRLRSAAEGVEVAGGLVWILECRDGWVMISPREQHQWDRWVEIMGRPDWTGQAEFCGDKAIRRANAAEIQVRMTEWARSRPKAEVFRLAQEGRVPCFPVSTAADLLVNEQLKVRQFFDTVATTGGRIPLPGLPFDLATTGGERLAKARTRQVPELAPATGHDPTAA
jgi:crotonobetainyl-CoA:carnitine CoA-transferase CaiB-like acyl-CoA transferase